MEFAKWFGITFLERSAEELDAAFAEPARLAELLDAVAALAKDDPDAFFAQQYLLSRIYGIHTQLPSGDTPENSTVLHAVTRRLEQDTIVAEDGYLDEELISSSPEDPEQFVPWLKSVVRQHTVFKHPYYHQFLRNEATEEDFRKFVLQESSVDARFDDLLATMQVGTDGATKMEIANNFWDEMGNGDPAQVHTVLFQRIIEHFGITDEELKENLSAEALLGGNLAVMICRYRNLFYEAVGHLAVAEWLAPDRFSQVLHGWERLGLPDDGITYHRLHIGIDAHHASGWFANVVKPMAGDAAARRAITRGAFWRLNSSGRYLDRILTHA
ncbi:iron-containing redox enzyme family protein [Streptomyces sp. TRM66268-LWL]|uniref:Iron-containing redox enzyme family protein n=2 Tax=Streptomyces polyasparticus TaxID=2767826 RepID=A0ABR7SP28_9ACTN|nr:iron-containing redox enzyme family protein [Streptomyces polyasparticus]